MLIKLRDGETRVVQPAQACGGMRIESFTLDFDDIHKRDWDELALWLKRVIFTRMVR